MKYYHDEDALEFEEQVLKSYFVGVHRSRSSSRRPEPSETFFVCKSYLGPDGDKDRIEALATGSTPEEQ